MSELPRWHPSAAPTGMAGTDGRARAESATAPGAALFAAVPAQSATLRSVAATERDALSESAPAAEPAPAATAEEFERPSSARVYDYLLGGAAHGAVDRELGDRLKRYQPGVVELARENRAFLRRAVRFLLAAGIEQFLDLGSGVPTMGNVHEVVARSRSGARVAYTDVDSIAALHGQHLLAALPTATYTAVDIEDVDAVLSSPGVAGLLDLRRPVGLLAFSVLQHVREDAAGLVGNYLGRLAPGSALALSHFTADDPRTGSGIEAEVAAYPRAAPLTRSYAEVKGLVTGVDLVDPGVVWADEWRPEPGRPAGAADIRGHWAAVGFRR